VLWILGVSSSLSLCSSFPLPARTNLALLATGRNTQNHQSVGLFGAYTVEVSYEGRSCEVEVMAEENILAAMERTGAADRLGITSLPSNCRRGNCLTCTGCHADGSNKASVVQGDDGLTPYMSEKVRREGYVLTCSSTVEGDGLKLILGKNSQVWDSIYKKRFEGEEAERMRMATQARMMFLRAESDVPRWKEETEESLRNNEDDAPPL